MSKRAKDRFISKIKNEYSMGDECMGEILMLTKPSQSMTLDECFEAFCELMNWSDGDAFLQVNQDDDSCLDITTAREYKCSEIFKE